MGYRRTSAANWGGVRVEIFIDGDACPVKDETYVVATRYGVRVVVGSKMLDSSLQGRMEGLRKKLQSAPLPSLQEA